MQSLELAKRYVYHVFWSDEDQEWVATVVEFPALSNLNTEPGPALEGIIDLVAVVIEDLLTQGQAVPVPSRMVCKEIRD